MEVTFGIVTGGGAEERIRRVLASIQAQHIKTYEVIVVGACTLTDNHLRVVPFDETVRPRWITRKKNIITREARYDCIVYMHDYIVLHGDWYQGFLRFGTAWDICMTPILNADGSRYRDWCLWPDDAKPFHMSGALLPYSVTHLSRYMYISGAYWVAKKSVMQQFPLDEALLWGEGEDLEWSKRVRARHTFRLNPLSRVQLVKQKRAIFAQVSPQEVAQKMPTA